MRQTGVIPSKRLWQGVRAWTRRVRLWKRLEIALFILAPISVLVTFAALSTKSSPTGVASGTVNRLLQIDMVLLLTLVALLGRRLARVWMAHRQGFSGSRLHGRMVGFFSFIAVAPAIMMAVFSAVILDHGIQSWFSEKVSTSLNNSLVVAESYVAEHRRVVQADIVAMASDLNRQAFYVQQNHRLLQLLVDDQTAKRALSEALVFDSTGAILARSTLNLELAPRGMPDMVLDRAKEGEVVMISSTDDDRVAAVLKLGGFFDAYLYVSRFVDPRVLSHVEAARGAIAEYQNLERDREEIQFGVDTFYVIAALLILMFAVWMGLSFASNLAEPIGRLVEAAEQVGKGDMTARVPGVTSPDEIGSLGRAFNRMTRQLESQQKALIDTNLKLDQRRRFTEAVLSGVSAGVIGLDRNYRISLPNRATCEFLDMSEEELGSKDIRMLMPELTPLLDTLAERPDEPVQGQINMVREGSVRTLLVRISAESAERTDSGYVLSFDDITEQLADQRTAAWADVARRIAHEIKNPLTPIQLSAERLQRKYGEKIKRQPEVFRQCTDTIVRQVADLRRMVDEFSSFARMPAPVFRIEDLNDIARQTMFMQEVGRPNIDFVLDIPDGDCPMVCDGRQIAQALTNLIKNAAESISHRIQAEAEAGKKPRKGRIRVVLRSDGERTTLSVEDNGSGLPKELAERLTEPYVTTRAKGTGLGLAIVRKILEDHGGALALNDRARGGVKVMMTFDHRKLLGKTLSAARDTIGEAVEDSTAAAE